MRKSSRIFWSVIPALALSVSAAWAQESPACSQQPGFAMVYSSGKNLPFSATVMVTHEQKLVDGNSIHTSGTTHQARSSTGKTMEEMPMGCFMDDEGEQQPTYRYTVHDNATRTTYSWNVGAPGDKIARVTHALTPPPRPPSPPISPEALAKRRAAMQAQREQMRAIHEPLGTKVIAGVVCEGSRDTRTIPGGAMGNELPIVTTSEMWSAKDLGLTMLWIEESPLNGKTTTEVTELNQAEPDPSIFMPPPGYTLQETETKTVAAPAPQ